jgi:hypothetical protein
MQVLDVKMPLGPISLRGRLRSGSTEPLVLAIGGLFPPPDQLAWIVDAFPESDVLVARLPGMWGPALASNTLEAITEAFDKAIGLVAAGRPRVLVGSSTGALVALGLGADRLILDEPFFRTGAFPFLTALALERAASQPDGRLAKFVEELLGITADDPRGRDLSHLMEAVRPGTVVLCGGRERGDWCSMTLPADRAALAARGARVLVGPPDRGHDVCIQGPGRTQLETEIRLALAQLKAQPPAAA